MASYAFYNLEPKENLLKTEKRHEVHNDFKLESLLPPPKPEKREEQRLFDYKIDVLRLETASKPHESGFSGTKTYVLANNGFKRYTQTNNLIDKVETFLSKPQQVSEKHEENNGKSHEKPETAEKTIETEEEERLDMKENRYFNLNPHFFCYRCHKPGHFQKTCPEEEDKSKPKCLFCLNEGHHMGGCDSFICYKCLKTGHMARECKSAGVSCYNCKKRGHKSRDCGVICDAEEEVNKGVVCMKCGKKGHVNCNKLEKKDGVYKKDKRGKKRWEDEDMKSNLEYFEGIEKDMDGRSKKIKKKKQKNKKKKKK